MASLQCVQGANITAHATVGHCGLWFMASAVNSAKLAEIISQYWIHQASCERGPKEKPVGSD
jgi:hypothetical protein